MKLRTGCALLALALLAAQARADAGAWLASGRQQLAEAKQLARTGADAPTRARNVILFLGDGMGMTTITAARILEGQRHGHPGEENALAFEKLPYVALAKTYNTNQQIPDSAGTMTALVSGAKTRAGLIALDETVPRGDHTKVEGHRLRTILEQAEQKGLATGVVTTTRVTHATPAACYAHAPDRTWEDDSDLPKQARADGFPDIARQLIEFPVGDGLEVVLGGGRANFLPKETPDPEYPATSGRREDGRDLTAEWTAGRPKAAYVWNGAQFRAIDPAGTDHLLGLFDPSHMQFEVDRSRDGAGEPSLSEMTALAIAILSRNPNGYFLMVEGGRIDHGHHLGNAYRALTETIEFSNAVRTALQLTRPGDTLVIVTADHDHSLTMAGYPERGNDILGLVRTTDARGELADELARDATGRPYTTLGYADGPGYTGASASQPEGPKRFQHEVAGQKPITRGRPDLAPVNTDDPDYLQEATVPLSSENHGGQDVPVFAIGPGAQLVHGVQEQSYFYQVMAAALGFANDPPGAGARR